MERETGIEPASSAWKAEVLPLNYSRPARKSCRTRRFRVACCWWREVDSNHRRRKPADLQSAPVGRLGIPPTKNAYCVDRAGTVNTSWHAYRIDRKRTRLKSSH